MRTIRKKYGRDNYMVKDRLGRYRSASWIENLHIRYRWQKMMRRLV